MAPPLWCPSLAQDRRRCGVVGGGDGLRHLGTEAPEVVGSPYLVIHAPDHALRQALSSFGAHDEVSASTCGSGRSFYPGGSVNGAERPWRCTSAMRRWIWYCCQSKGCRPRSRTWRPRRRMQCTVRFTCLHALGFGDDVAIQLSGAVKPSGDVHKAFQRHFGTVDLHYGRFIPALGPVTGLHRQHFLPVIQLIRCA